MKFTYDSVFGIIWSIIYGNIMLSCFQVYNQSCSKMSSVKAMDEGGPKKSFPSEPLITLQYETSLYSDTSWAYEINSSKLPFLSSCAHPYPSSMALTILSLSNTPITVSWILPIMESALRLTAEGFRIEQEAALQNHVHQCHLFRGNRKEINQHDQWQTGISQARLLSYWDVVIMADWYS